MLSPEEAKEATKLLSGVLLNKLKFTGDDLGDRDEKFGSEFRRLVELDYKVCEKYGEILVGFKANTEALLRAEQAVNQRRMAMREFVQKSSHELHSLQEECNMIREKLSNGNPGIQFTDNYTSGARPIVTPKSGIPQPRAYGAVFDQKALSEFVRSMMAAHKLGMANDGEATIEELCKRILENGVQNDPLTLATEARERERSREVPRVSNK